MTVKRTKRPMKIRGRDIEVISGKDRGKSGKVMRVDPEQASASTSRG